MSAFLTRLIERANGTSPVIQPLLRSRFAFGSEIAEAPFRGREDAPARTIDDTALPLSASPATGSAQPAAPRDAESGPRPCSALSVNPPMGNRSSHADLWNAVSKSEKAGPAPAVDRQYIGHEDQSVEQAVECPSWRERSGAPSAEPSFAAPASHLLTTEGFSQGNYGDNGKMALSRIIETADPSKRNERDSGLRFGHATLSGNEQIERQTEKDKISGQDSVPPANKKAHMNKTLDTGINGEAAHQNGTLPLYHAFPQNLKAQLVPERPGRVVLHPAVISPSEKTGQLMDKDSLALSEKKRGRIDIPAGSAVTKRTEENWNIVGSGADEGPASIKVTIGRIEVRAAGQQPPSQRRTVPATPRLSLDDYLKKHSRGKG